MKVPDDLTGLSYRPRRCQYGATLSRCGSPATTKRPRPNGQATWDLCPGHAAFLDRLRERIRTDGALLERLAMDRPPAPAQGELPLLLVEEAAT